MSIEQLEAEMLKLDAENRSRLAGLLLRSLDENAAEELERLWVEECLKRDAEMDADPTLSIPAEEVFRDARARLAQG